MASHDLVGLAMPFILTLASILLPSLLIFFVFFKKLTPRSDLATDPGHEQGNLPNPTAAAESYEVFLSFRGPDTRTGFTDFLYESLKGAGVRVFRDDEELRVGEEIGPELFRGIEQSQISIPIFSKGYASSKWCLKEAALMMECKKMRKQLILPIFYNVSPDEVKYRTGSYAKAFSKHQKKYGSVQVQQWSHALAEIGALKGWELKNIAAGHEGRLINFVVAKVLSELKKANLLVTEKLVEMDDRVQDVKRLLDVEVRDVRIIGLWGMGGIGKTTLAKVIYNQLAGDFERCSFLPDVREASKQHDGLKKLQEQLVADLSRSRQERPNFSSIDEGVNEIRNRFDSMRVLILLDDIDRTDQLKALAQNVGCFGPGSRIIVTTRNREALRLSLVGLTYEVKGMNRKQALQLFHKHAFWKDHPTPEQSELSRKIVETTGGLPLAIEVISSFLSGKRISIWRATLVKSKDIPHEEIQKRLRINYEALQHEEQQIFLDIACFFIGKDKRDATHMWEDCKFHPDVAIDVLEMMSLIKIQDSDKFWMHDQLRDLGREIVRHENYNIPGRRSRLWSKEDAISVLGGSEGTECVEAISVQFERDEIKRALDGKSFANLSKLRYLQLYRADVAGNFQHLSSKMRWLSLPFCRVACTTPNFHLPNLVILDLSDSFISDEFWDCWRPNQICEKLKVLKLSWCKEITTTPDLSIFPNLESMILDYSGVSQFPKSIDSLLKLQHLSALMCRCLRMLPAPIGQLESLTYLDLSFTRIATIGNMSNLKIYGKLKVLNLRDCSEIIRSLDFSVFPNLERLMLDRSTISQIPESICSLLKLQSLSIRACYFLRVLPYSIGQLESLTFLDLSKTRIETLPDSVGNLSNLEELNIDDCPVFRLPRTLKKLHKLKKVSGWKYDVFLSFRVRDTSRGFTDQLCHKLEGSNVHVSMSNEELCVGEEFGPGYIREIEQCYISIPIFSKGYASSNWCLREAALMMECRKKMRNLLILPIFYDVTPEEVKHQTGSYAESFSQHLENYGTEQVQQWRHALAEIGALEGLELKKDANG